MVDFNSLFDFLFFCDRVIRDFRYFFSDDDERFLQAVADTCEAQKTVLKKGTKLWRAQLGCKENKDQEYPNSIQFYPYSHDRMKPIPRECAEGRINPKGIAYLYLSDDCRTAMSEVRPWIGAQVTIGEFWVRSDLKILDIRSPEFPGNNAPDHILIEWANWEQIGRAFSKPVSSSEHKTEYIPTQIISEKIRSLGFGGIKYKSSIGEGFNYVFFDIESAIVSGDLKISRCNKINYEFDDLSLTDYNGRL